MPSIGRLAAPISLVLVLFAGILVPATASHAAETGRISGVIAPSVATGWDGLVTVEARENKSLPAKYPTEIDPITGAFSLDVPLGEYVLFVDYHGTGNFLDRFWGPTDTNPSSIYVVSVTTVPQPSRSITVHAGSEISGVIQGDGKAIESPTAALTPLQFQLNKTRVTVDPASGAYKIDRIAPGDYRLSFGDEGWFTQWWPLSSTQNGATPITFGAGTTLTGYDAMLRPGSVVTGTVTLPSPSGSTYVQLYQNGEAKYWEISYGGTYRFDFVEPGTYTVKFGYGTGYGLRDEWWPGVRDAEDATPITVAAGATVSGIDAVMEITPDIAGQVTYLRGSEVLAYQYMPVELLKEDPAGSGEYTVVSTGSTNWNAAYRFENVDFGNYKVRVAGDSWAIVSSTFWPSARTDDAAGVIAIREETTSEVVADVIMAPWELDDTDRVAGPNRFETAVAGTKLGFRDSDVPVPVLYIVNGLNYPDALSAGPAAVHEGGALLMVKPTSIPEAVMVEIERLDPARIVIVGGPTSVSTGVESQLESVTGDVIRIAGANRYETSRMVTDQAFGESDDVLIAQGSNFPDALAAGPAAAQRDAPVVLVKGDAADLDQATATLLSGMGVQNAYVLGSEASVSLGIEADLAETGATIKRLSGPNRYWTALAIAEEFFTESDVAFVATGKNFPDALGGGALAGTFGAPLFLTDGTCLLEGALRAMYKIETTQMYVLGSTSSVSDTLLTPKLCY